MNTEVVLNCAISEPKIQFDACDKGLGKISNIQVLLRFMFHLGRTRK